MVAKAKRRGAHRRKRERKPLIGMMLHQDGSRHEWLPTQQHDLIVTLDDATGAIYSAFLVDEEDTMSSFAGVAEVILEFGLFNSLYTDRGSHYWHTAKAGGKVDPDNPTQFRRALNPLGIEMIPAYSPEARGRLEEGVLAFALRRLAEFPRREISARVLTSHPELVEALGHAGFIPTRGLMLMAREF